VLKILWYLHYYQGQKADSSVKNGNVCILRSKTICPTGQL